MSELANYWSNFDWSKINVKMVWDEEQNKYVEKSEGGIPDGYYKIDEYTTVPLETLNNFYAKQSTNVVQKITGDFFISTANLEILNEIKNTNKIARINSQNYIIMPIEMVMQNINSACSRQAVSYNEMPSSADEYAKMLTNIDYGVNCFAFLSLGNRPSYTNMTYIYWGFTSSAYTLKKDMQPEVIVN